MTWQLDFPRELIRYCSAFNPARLWILDFMKLRTAVTTSFRPASAYRATGQWTTQKPPRSSKNGLWMPKTNSDNSASRRRNKMTDVWLALSITSKLCSQKPLCNVHYENALFKLMFEFNSSCLLHVSNILLSSSGAHSPTWHIAWINAWKTYHTRLNVQYNIPDDEQKMFETC